MQSARRALTATFNRFFDSEKSSGVILIVCTIASLLAANSPLGTDYLGLWESRIGTLSILHLINDGLMAIFFLLIGLELERELYSGELSSIRNAALPVFAALGGMLAPALIHGALNAGTPTQAGFGVPMATDIAFAFGVLALLGARVPASLKVFVVAFAVIDDLGAIVIIAAFYTAKISLPHLGGALAVWFALMVCNRMRVMSLILYLLGGGLIWLLMLKSGVHATIAGVMLAFAIPYSAKDEDQQSPSHRLEHALHKPVAFLILPIFALANTGVVIDDQWMQGLISANGVGVFAGLVLGKPIGVTLFCLAAVYFGLCRLPADMNWKHLVGAGILGGIGFTMSIFIANLAFAADPAVINASKMAILLASLTAGIAGFAWLRFFSPSPPVG